jgi:tRNA pseudouridine38-40 synthase
VKTQKYRIDLAYLGTRFSGFQSQVDGNAVQDHVERALQVAMRIPKIRIRGASRTDRGVHAEWQVATFSHLPGLDLYRLHVQLNGILPLDIRVLSLQVAEAHFSPISAVSKVYRYRVWEGRCYNPMVIPYVWQIQGPIDVDCLRAEANSVVGFHDFSSFCNQDSDAKTKERTLLGVEVERRGSLVNIWVQGDGFLKQMVRILVGTWVEAAIGKRKPGQLPALLAAKDRRLAGVTAAAKGLTLVELFYEETPPLSTTIQKSDAGFTVALV